MKLLYPFVFLAVFFLVKTTPVLSQSPLSAEDVSEQYLHQTFRLTDLDEDNYLIISELEAFPREFGWLLRKDNYNRADIDEDGNIDEDELKNVITEIQEFRYREETAELGTLFKKNPFLHKAKIKYYLRHTDQTEILFSNLKWTREHPDLVEKLITRKALLRDNINVVSAIHRNFTFLFENPGIAEKLYQHDAVEGVSDMDIWRAEHEEFLAQNPGQAEKRYFIEFPGYSLPEPVQEKPELIAETKTEPEPAAKESLVITDLAAQEEEPPAEIAAAARIPAPQPVPRPVASVQTPAPGLTAKADIDRYEFEIYELKLDLNNLQQSYQQSQTAAYKTIDSLKTANNRLVTQIRTMADQVFEERVVMDTSLNQRIRMLEADLALARIEEDSLLAENIRQGKYIVNLEKEITAVRDEQSEAGSARMDYLQKELEWLQKENIALSDSMASVWTNLSQEIQKLRVEKSLLKEENEVLTTVMQRVQNQYNQNDSLSREIASLRSELNLYRNKEENSVEKEIALQLEEKLNEARAEITISRREMEEEKVNRVLTEQKLDSVQQQLLTLQNENVLERVKTNTAQIEAKYAKEANLALKDSMTRTQSVLNQKISQLRLEKDQAFNDRDELSQIMNGLKTRIAILENSNDSLVTENTLARQKLEEISNSLSAKEAQIKSLNQQEEKDISQTQIRIDQLEGSLREKELALQALQEQLREQEKTAAAEEQTQEITVIDVDPKNLEVEILYQENLELERKIGEILAEYKEERSRKEAEKDSLLAQMDDLYFRITDLEKALASANTAGKDITARKKTADTQDNPVESLEFKIEELTYDNQKLREELELNIEYAQERENKLKQELLAAKSETQRMVSQNARLERRKKKYRVEKEVKLLTSELESAEKKIGELTRKNEDLKFQLETSFSYLEEQMHKHEKLEAEMQAKMAEMARIGGGIDSMSQSSRAASAPRINWSDSLRTYRMDLLLAEEQISDFQRLVQREKVMASQAQDSLNAKINRLEVEKSKLAGMEQVNNRRVKIIEIREQELKKLEQKLEQRSQLIDQREKFIKERKDELQQLENKYQDLLEREKNLDLREQRLNIREASGKK